MKTTAQNKMQKGFTLIELLVVIGILAVLLSITLIAINPARQFAQANDTKRASDVNAILNAVGEYMADNKGQLPSSASGTEIGSAAAELGSGAGQVDICSALVTQYMAALPVDPNVNNGTSVTDCNQTYDTGYTISKGGDNRVTVTAPRVQIQSAISVTR
jgi:type IV pilus assembly protein PilA